MKAGFKLVVPLEALLHTDICVVLPLQKASRCFAVCPYGQAARTAYVNCHLCKYRWNMFISVPLFGLPFGKSFSCKSDLDRVSRSAARYVLLRDALHKRRFFQVVL